ncbi:hypothetical protein LEP1GSC097_1577 [Leptospira interrogans serovar Grippotyphosa str. UI 08368]|nr:hypothetical protein LEP1GSC097_1577 [Leptospira interrogans serovar Grippotyphosa str. UI 08368]
MGAFSNFCTKSSFYDRLYIKNGSIRNFSEKNLNFADRFLKCGNYRKLRFYEQIPKL